MMKEIYQVIVNADKHNIESKIFKDINITDTFFNSFRKWYGLYYNEWVDKKKDDRVFCVEEAGKIIAFMEFKIEDETEDYSDINPPFPPGRRMKLSSFKTINNNPGVSIKLMELLISEATFNNITEIYGTIPTDADYKKSLVRFVNKFGFNYYGTKESRGMKEDVFVKSIWK